VVQNAANSGVGRWVIAFAKTRGLKTVNIVRRPELVAELKAIGGDVVVIDSPDVSERIKAAVGQAELRLALDGVSAPATGVLAATLSPHGTLVSFAAMSETPMSINPLDVIFKPLTMRGFWLGHPEVAAKIAPAIAQAAAMIASGRVHIPVAATYLLHQGSGRACATRRKDPSGRRRIIHLTSKSSIRYAVGTPRADLKKRSRSSPAQTAASVWRARRAKGRVQIPGRLWAFSPEPAPGHSPG
jgi:NADPH:quinone reductase-like Zn-dependent oxidoreductase